MKKYYTRACNFYYGNNANLLIQKKLALPLCGNKNIAFDKVEIFTRKNDKTSSKIINLKKINTLSYPIKKETAIKMSENWKPYRSVATWYFWRSLDPIPVEY